MKALTRADYELLTEAQRVIQSNYDEAEQNHTVGAAVRCKSGNVYAGVNVYSLHGACAEQVAIGTAITQGEREFEAIVADRGKDGGGNVPPCGNCRQKVDDYMPECRGVLRMDGEGKNG